MCVVFVFFACVSMGVCVRVPACVSYPDILFVSAGTLLGVDNLAKAA